jgi:hypothetical protein
VAAVGKAGLPIDQGPWENQTRDFQD